tara:strand:- start:887 stop:1249 length:363 start_codon:yes stop_codon:yes gene_type:complete
MPEERTQRQGQIPTNFGLDNPQTGSGGGGGQEQMPEIPDIDGVLAEADAATKQCCVMHGSHVQYCSVGGQTVKNVRKTFRTMFNIPEGARALVKGEEVTEDQVILPGQTLEFVKESGVKG